MMKSDSPSDLFLICRSDSRLCALPLENVAETMRSLPIEPMPDMPPFLLGVSIIRGIVVPVVCMTSLFGANLRMRHARMVTLKLGERRVAFAVDDVIGIRKLDREATDDIPPLLGSADASLIELMTTLDAELIVVLRGAHMIPESAWSKLDEKRVKQ